MAKSINTKNVTVNGVEVSFNGDLYNKLINFGLNEGLVDMVNVLEVEFGEGLMFDEAIEIFEPKLEDIDENSFTLVEKQACNYICDRLDLDSPFDVEEVVVELVIPEVSQVESEPEVQQVPQVIESDASPYESEQVEQDFDFGDDEFGADPEFESPFDELISSVPVESEPEVQQVSQVEQVELEPEVQQVTSIEPEIQPETKSDVLNIVIPEIKIEIQPEVKSDTTGVLNIDIPDFSNIPIMNAVQPITPVINKVDKPIPKKVEKVEPEIQIQVPTQVGNLVLPDLTSLISVATEKVTTPKVKPAVQGVVQQVPVTREKIELNQPVLSLILGAVAAAMKANSYNPDVTGETMSLDLIANKATILSKINRSKNAVAALGRTFENPEIEVYVMSDQLGWLIFTSGNHVIVMDNNFNGPKMNLIACELIADPTNILDPVIKTIVGDFTKYIKTFKKNGGHVPGATAWK
jgi:hypothetical protein